VGSHLLSLDGATCLTAEGIFAIDFLAVCRAAGVATEAIYIDRPGAVVFWLRLRRDLSKKRKPPMILLRRGLALWQAQPALRRKAMAAGFTPMSMRAAIAHLSVSAPAPASEPAESEGSS
jgi:uridine kinase